MSRKGKMVRIQVKTTCTCFEDASTHGHGYIESHGELNPKCKVHGFGGCQSCENLFSGLPEFERPRQALLKVTGKLAEGMVCRYDDYCRPVIHDRDKSDVHWVCLVCRNREDVTS